MDKKLVVRQFYEEYLKKFFVENPYKGISGFKSNCRIGGAGVSGSGDEPPINVSGSINNSQGVPVSVLDAFDRHLWYAQHSLSDISVLKVPVSEIPTFAICINGYVDDGWDNSGQFIEVYDEHGQLMGSAILPSDDDEDAWQAWTWMDRPIKGDDFDTPSPPHPQEVANDQSAETQKQVIDARQLYSLIPPVFMSIYQSPNPIIYVGNLYDQALENDIKFIFADYGTVRQVCLVKDSQAEIFAFIEMTEEKGAKSAVFQINGAKWRTSKLQVVLVQPPMSISN
ncbi:RNA recognition motif domain-containing protein [Calothrix sp. NIES-2098]|uniref:RNA recognition motif domain-containing protein n=1 Tax=Calothrix sp. NIES-2098 TaxID=1954171 RepID=UPI000B60D488|nr:RNA-binding protein [Calothrix sp. NIES-2098]